MRLTRWIRETASCIADLVFTVIDFLGFFIEFGIWDTCPATPCLRCQDGRLDLSLHHDDMLVRTRHPRGTPVLWLSCPNCGAFFHRCYGERELRRVEEAEWRKSKQGRSIREQQMLGKAALDRIYEWMRCLAVGRIEDAMELVEPGPAHSSDGVIRILYNVYEPVALFPDIDPRVPAWWLDKARSASKLLESPDELPRPSGFDVYQYSRPVDCVFMEIEHDLPLPGGWGRGCSAGMAKFEVFRDDAGRARIRLAFLNV